MPSFVYSPLLWALLLVGVPVLIHLINMFRHRRVQWAAMEFLLASQRKNRTRVLLRQFLLLAARIAVVALAVLMVAQPRLRDAAASLWGNARVHYVVLLDDSYSMADRWGDTSAFDQAKGALRHIVRQALAQGGAQSFTLLRYSQAGNDGRQPIADLVDARVDAALVERLDEVLDSLEPSHSAANALPAIDGVEKLLGKRPQEERVVYLVSDVRLREWGQPKALRNRLARLSQGGHRLRFIGCVDEPHANLAVAEVRAADGIRAAGVPIVMQVSVTNYGSTAARDVPVLVEADGQLQPAIRIGEIAAWQTVSERVAVRFATAGQHSVTARLDADAVSTDNAAHIVLDLSASAPVLIVDGDPMAANAQYLSAALSPGGPVTTGIAPRVESARFLARNPLGSFHAIYMLDVEQIDPAAVEALERYARDGGGVAFFLGPRTRTAVVNEVLYRGGSGLFPAPLEGSHVLPVDRLERVPDIKASSHPVFRVFAATRNSFLATVAIDRYFAVGRSSAPGAAAARVIAELRNGAPLAVEKAFGRGRVVAFLTTASPQWNNWSRNNPSYVVAMLELQSYLASHRGLSAAAEAGRPLSIELDATLHTGEVELAFDTADGSEKVAVNAVPQRSGALVALIPSVPRSGVLRATLNRKEGESDLRLVASNVDAREGDLRTAESAAMATAFAGLPYRYDQASRLTAEREQLAGYNLGKLLLALLVALLLGEQLMAWAAGYHPRFTARAAQK